MWTDKVNLKTQFPNLSGVQFPYKIRLLTDSITIYTEMGLEYVTVSSVLNKDFPEIIEVREGKELIL